MKASTFEFGSARWSSTEKQATFSYAIHFEDSPIARFTETLRFPKVKTKKLPTLALKEWLKNLHLILGLSYYKLYCPPTFKLPYTLTIDEAQFWNTVYEKGLGEFFYRNQIDFRGLIRFPFKKNAKALIPIQLATQEQALLGIGGGKDSIVAGEFLKRRKVPLKGFVLETGAPSSIVKEVSRKMGLRNLIVQRQLDPKILKPWTDSYNGHIPISAIFAFVGTFTAALHGYRYMVVGNEASSNLGNVHYLGTEINHQWSKSGEFEALFQNHIRNHLTSSTRYFSAIRHLYEIRVVEEFVKHPQYFSVFSSCNRSFRVSKERPKTLWCGECPKCAFVFAELSAFLTPAKLIPIFGRDLFKEEALIPLYKDLAGLGKIKPFDCVGTFEETRAALRLAAPKWGKTAVLKALLPLLKTHFPKDPQAELFTIQNAPTLPDHFKFLGLKNLVLLGYGKEGQVTHLYLKKYYPDLTVFIADEAKNPRALSLQEKAEFAVKTPGLPKTKVSLPYTTATNIFFSQNTRPTIGITGSKGKSTTASLIQHFLKNGGLNTELLGNIGKPMLSALLTTQPQDRIYVLELSSYQLDDLKESPHIAVVTNLFPEHMNYHGGVEPYYEAKKNILRYQTAADFFIQNTKHPILKKWHKFTPAQRHSFSDWHPKSSPLLGKHNQSNVAAAAAVAELFKVSRSTLGKALSTFKPLKHRLQNIGTFHGITFYDDAISTSPESTIEALKALSALAPIGTIFLGGEDRGYDFTELEKELRRCKIKNVVLFPETGQRMLRSTRGFKVLHARSMREAVAFAYEHTPKASLCLLSTASPSYSLWKNFEEKGEDFEREVLQQAKVDKI